MILSDSVRIDGPRGRWSFIPPKSQQPSQPVCYGHRVSVQRPSDVRSRISDGRTLERHERTRHQRLFVERMQNLRCSICRSMAVTSRKKTRTIMRQFDNQIGGKRFDLTAAIKGTAIEIKEGNSWAFIGQLERDPRG